MSLVQARHHTRRPTFGSCYEYIIRGRRCFGAGLAIVLCYAGIVKKLLYVPCHTSTATPVVLFFMFHTTDGINGNGPAEKNHVEVLLPKLLSGQRSLVAIAAEGSCQDLL